MLLWIVVVRPILLYACEIRPTTKGDEEKIATFERRIYGPKRIDIAQQYNMKLEAF